MQTENPTIARLESQINWYDEKSLDNQKTYKVCKIIEMIAAAIIPFAAGYSAPAFFTGGLGVIIVVLEGVQQLFQYHNNWIAYRSTCESLKHEKYLYLGNAGPYLKVEDKIALLAERVESLVSKEHAKWIRGRTEEK
jgi:hypothetical protein